MADHIWPSRTVSAVTRHVQRRLMSFGPEREGKAPHSQGREMREAPGRLHQGSEGARAVDHRRLGQLRRDAHAVVRGREIEAAEAPLAHVGPACVCDDEGAGTEREGERVDGHILMLAGAPTCGGRLQAQRWVRAAARWWGRDDVRGGRESPNRAVRRARGRFGAPRSPVNRRERGMGRGGVVGEARRRYRGRGRAGAHQRAPQELHERGDEHGRRHRAREPPSHPGRRLDAAPRARR